MAGDQPPSMIGWYIRLYMSSTSGDHGGLGFAGGKQGGKARGKRKTGVSAAMPSEAHGFSPFPNVGPLEWQDMSRGMAKT
jgi:hypothetical protein